MSLRNALFAALLALGCGGEAAPKQPAPTRHEQALNTQTEPSPEAATPALGTLLDGATDAGLNASGEDAGDDGWEKFSRKDDVPLCVFATDTERLRALFLKDVKKQKLRANSELTLGVYAPGCASEACIDRPTLQCWAELEGDVIVVNSRYSGKRHRDRVCSTNCESVIAGCPLPPLPAGKHTVRYGDRTLSLTLPSSPNKPCLRVD